MKLRDIAKPWVGSLETYQPGKPIEEVARELGLGDPLSIVKLASNENALGPSPRALEAMRLAAERMHLYPDGDSYYLREAIAKKFGVSRNEVFIGHGSNEILALLGHAFLEPGVSAVMSEKAFIIYKLVAALYQAEAIETPARNLGHDLDAMLAAIRPDTRLVFIANPNNPTGTFVEPAALDRFLERLPAHVAAVVDEAYLELLPPRLQPDSIRHVRTGRNVFVLRTFSKAHGLAGLRIGYAIAPPDGIDLLNRVRQPFNVNAMAQAAALAALDDEDHIRRTREMVQEGLDQLCQGLAEMGFEYVPSAANFLLVKVGNGRRYFEALLRQRVIVRPVDGYGLPDYIRVSVGTRDENERFLDALAAVRNLPA
ncbi:MAG: histidinol-phosphate transaminase [Kiritimatiellae bacterium]|nr:histidinol-phosphate transaminase [Kiritimatiellia bacterium]MDW8458406.1 histidinol-phosphate transaminase [Verrucomicrobiota bacterium]